MSFNEGPSSLNGPRPVATARSWNADLRNGLRTALELTSHPVLVGAAERAAEQRRQRRAIEAVLVKEALLLADDQPVGQLLLEESFADANAHAQDFARVDHRQRVVPARYRILVEHRRTFLDLQRKVLPPHCDTKITRK
eukprot:2388652-Prymnesium_polylepis.1